MLTSVTTHISDWSLKKKLGFVIATPVVSMMLLYGTSAFHTQVLNSQTRTNTEQIIGLLRSINAIDSNNALLAREARNIIMSDEQVRFDASKKQMLALIGGLEKQMDALIADGASPSLLATLKALKTLNSELNGHYHAVLKQSEAGQIEAASLILLNKADPLEQKIDQSIDQLIETSKASIEANIADTEAGSLESLLLIGGIALGLILISAGLVMVVSRSLHHQIGGEPSDASSLMHDISNGNLNQSIQSSHSNSLIHDMLKFCQHLRQIMGNVKHSALSLHDSSKEFLNFAQNISDSARNQANVSHIAASSVKKLSDAAQSVSNYAAQNMEQASNSMQTAEQGFLLMKNLLSQMENMSKEMKLSTTEITTLVERSDKISSIVAVIQSIAEQTNLLALNAAIEAARAGEEGRGFAVVADEVRKLAGNTSKATEEIKHLIEEVCASSERSKNSVTCADSTVQHTMQYAKELQAGLSGIIDSLKASSNNTVLVSSASQEQLSTSQHIEKQVAHMAEQSESLNRASTELISKTQGLEEQSEQLKKAASFFNV